MLRAYQPPGALLFFGEVRRSGAPTALAIAPGCPGLACCAKFCRADGAGWIKDGEWLGKRWQARVLDVGFESAAF